MSAQTATRPSYFSWMEAALYSGLSVTSLRRLVAEGRLTAYRPTPARTLLSREQLDALIESSSAPQPAA